MQAVLKQSGASVYLDATKNLVNTVLMAASRVDMHIIQITRDARAQIASALKYQPQLSVETATQDWVTEVETARHVLGQPRFKTVTLRYENCVPGPPRSWQTCTVSVGLIPR